MTLSFNLALETILHHVRVLDIQDSLLLESLGQVIAENVQADINVPDWDASTRDGFAVKAEDIQSASGENPRILKVIETVRAGSRATGSLISGTAIRIMTGAPIPAGADCVVEFEQTDDNDRRQNNSGRPLQEIGVRHEVKKGANIQRAGEQILRGAQVITKGTVIGPAEISVLAALGKTQARVTRRPRVAVIATGDELVSPGKSISAQQIYSSNSFGVAAQISLCGGIPEMLGAAEDNRLSILEKIRSGMNTDAVITIGGSSKGDYDLVKDTASELGEILFREVQMAPGKSFGFGLIKKINRDGELSGIPFFALTGNPSASMMSFELLVRPAVLKMMGKGEIQPRIVAAVSEEQLVNKKSGRRFIWATVIQRDNVYYARPSRTPDKGIIPSVSISGGLIVMPEETPVIEKGEKVQVILTDWH